MTELERAAYDLITEFGSTATLRTVLTGDYNPDTGAVSRAEVSQYVRAVLVDLTLQSNGLSLRYGTEVLTGDKEAYVLPPEKTGGNPVTFSPGVDTLTVGGVQYTVVTVKEGNTTGSSPFVYFMYLRR